MKQAISPLGFTVLLFVLALIVPLILKWLRR